MDALVTAAGAPAVATGTMAMAACAPAAVAGEAALEVAASGAPAATAVAASAAEAGARSPPLAAGTAPLDDLAAWCQRLGDPAEAAEHDYAMDYSNHYSNHYSSLLKCHFHYSSLLRHYSKGTLLMIATSHAISIAYLKMISHHDCDILYIVYDN